MHRSRLLPAAVLCACGVCACAELTGLDQVTERGCAPLCGEDGASPLPRGIDGSTATPETGVEDAVADRMSERDQGASDSSALDAFVDSIGPASDSGEDDASGDASGDAAGLDDAGPRDARADGSGPAGDAEPSEGGGPHDAGDGGCSTLLFSDTFDNSAKGWSLDANWSIASTCASPPAPQAGKPDPSVDHTTGKAGGVLGYFVCGNNPGGQVVTPAVHATSPAVDVTSASTVTLSFYRYLNTDSSTWMASTVDVFDGSTWQNVYTNPSGATSTVMIADGVWTQVSYDLTAYKNKALQVRFGFAATSTSVYSMSSWNVDDLTITGTGCH